MLVGSLLRIGMVCAAGEVPEPRLAYNLPSGELKFHFVWKVHGSSCQS
jgi:hypothetical protein